MQPPSPEVIAGKYRLLRKLGQGGMGTVWYAEHLTLRSPVAIKLIDSTIADNPEALGRFLREAQSAASLRSPHVVQILDHGVDNGVPYIAMELLEGESLAERLERVGRLSPTDTARILQHVGRAIGRAHEAEIVHRDLKPDNIYLVRNDDEEIAKVLDFGIAKASNQGLGAAVSGGTRTGAVMGTPYYMSPEQAEGAKSLDGRADIWAMGVIAFECLLGSRPFDEEALGSLLLAICARAMPIPSQRGPVPAGFDHWFARACARDVTQRFALARDAASELRLVCEGNATLSGNYASPLAAHSGGYTPSAAALSHGSNAPTGQSDAGLASTQFGQPSGAPRKRAFALAFGLIGAAVLAIGGSLLAWSQLGRNAAGVASASASATAVLPSATAHVEPTALSPVAAPPASVVPAPEAAALASAVPTAATLGPARPAAGAPRPTSAKPRVVTPARPAAHAAVARPTLAPKDTRVNLGL